MTGGKARMNDPVLWMKEQKFRELLKDNSLEVEAANRETLRLFSCLSALLLWILSLAGLIFHWGRFMQIYFLFFSICLCFYFIARLCLPKLHCAVCCLPLLYGISLCLYALAYLLSPVATPGGSNVAMVAMLIMIPLAILDVPVRVFILLLAMNSVYLLGAFWKLEPEQAIDVAVNCLVFSSMSFVFSRYYSGVKLRAIDAQRRLAIESYSDVLTGLGNRRKLFERLAALERPDSPERLTGALMTDIDWFKQYNDFYGHQKGDECLRTLGTVLRKAGEGFDLEYFRYGGEEFLALCTYENPDRLKIAADALCKTVWNAGIPFQNQKTGRVTVSVGYAFLPEHGDVGYEMLINHADIALYQAKDQGRNKAVEYVYLEEGADPGKDTMRTAHRQHCDGEPSGNSGSI